MDRPRIVVTTPVPQVALDRLAERAEVVDVSARPRSEWDEALATARGVLVNSNVPVDEAFIVAAPALRIVSTVSVGTDNIDRAALARRGIPLTNSQGSLTEAVADLAFWLVMTATRRLSTALAWVTSGRWMERPAPYGHDLAGATLGIIGMGTIGASLARRAHVSGMRIIYSNRTPRDDDERTGASYRPFEGLLAEADCIVILVPLTDQTRGMFNDAAFARMKPNATLVNAARGPIVDTDALLRALEAGRIAGAALDVTEPEPIPPDHPLLQRDDVIVVPHIGSATVETRTRMALLAVDNLLAEIAGSQLLTLVGTA